MTTMTREGQGPPASSDTDEREARLRNEIDAAGERLVRREDGFYEVITADGETLSSHGWRVRNWQLNERDGESGSPYPGLTLDDVEHWLRGENMTS
jgi:hypothetical protein